MIDQRYPSAWIKTTVNVSPEHHKLCKDHRIRFSDAMRAGIGILLAERGVQEYNSNLNIVRKVRELKLKAAEYATKAARLENGSKD